MPDGRSSIVKERTVSFTSARNQFLEVAERAGALINTHIHPLTGPNEAILATDTAYVGSDQARKLLVVTSGVHGVELYPGSDAQVHWLSKFDRELKTDIGILFIHGINPWGTAFGRRANEDNVDLCRNFVDWSSGTPMNEDYETLHPFLCVSSLKHDVQIAAQEKLSKLCSKNGRAWYATALMKGQYSHPNGLQFGGTRSTWSRETLELILKQSSGSADQICLIDLHSGVGPFGYGSTVCMHRGKAAKRAEKWFGGWTIFPRSPEHERDPNFYDVTGHSSDGYETLLGAERITSVVLEFGTSPAAKMQEALREDHWLTFHGDISSPQGQAIKERLLEVFYPDDPEWRLYVCQRTEQVIRQALTGMAMS